MKSCAIFLDRDGVINKAIVRNGKAFSPRTRNEFVIKYDGDIKKINKYLLRRNIQGGFLLEEFYPQMKNCMLFGTSELHNDIKFEKLISVLKEVNNV